MYIDLASIEAHISHQAKATWHLGYPLSQTLFTSLHIDRLLWPEPVTLQKAQFSHEIAQQKEEPLLHQVLRAYCLGTVKACDLVHTMVSGQHYFEVSGSHQKSQQGDGYGLLTPVRLSTGRRFRCTVVQSRTSASF